MLFGFYLLLVALFATVTNSCRVSEPLDNAELLTGSHCFCVMENDTVSVASTKAKIVEDFSQLIDVIEEKVTRLMVNSHTKSDTNQNGNYTDNTGNNNLINKAKDSIAITNNDNEINTSEIPELFSCSSPIKLNIGGVHYTTSLLTLLRFPDSMIGTMFSGRFQLQPDSDGCYFIDRDGTNFSYILNFLRSPEEFEIQTIPSTIILDLYKESKFYLLQDEMFPNNKEKEIIQNGYHINLLYDRHQFWYMEYKRVSAQYGRHEDKIKAPAIVCTHCDCAYPDMPMKGYVASADLIITDFRIGRIVMQYQFSPKHTDIACILCGYMT